MIPFKPSYLPLAVKGIVFAMYSLVPVTALQAQALEEIQQLPNVVVSTTASTRVLERAMASVSVVDGYWKICVVSKVQSRSPKACDLSRKRITIRCSQ